MTRSDGPYLRAATPSQSPMSVRWQFKDFHTTTWHDDLALMVTGLSEKPSFESEAEITIRLSEDVRSDINKSGVEGVYKPNGSYYMGRPVLQLAVLFLLSLPRTCGSLLEPPPKETSARSLGPHLLFVFR